MQVRSALSADPHEPVRSPLHVDDMNALTLYVPPGHTQLK
jgi:hypothetical protein